MLATSRPFEIVAVVASIGFLFSAATLAVRYGFHGAAMEVDLTDARFETWTFSAVWAVFGALVLMLGVLRAAPTLRWAGLTLLIGTALKVLLVDMDQLEDWVRIASLVVVGALFMATTLAVRRFAPAAGEPQK